MGSSFVQAAGALFFLFHDVALYQPVECGRAGLEFPAQMRAAQAAGCYLPGMPGEPGEFR